MNRRYLATVACGVMFSLSSHSLAETMPGPGIVGTVEGGSGSVVAVYADDGDGQFDPEDVMITSQATDSEGKFAFHDLDMTRSYFVMHDDVVSELQHIGRIQSFIDSFDISQAVVSDPTTSVDSNFASGPLEAMLGGFRDMYLGLLSGAAEGKLRINPFSQTSRLQIDMSAGVSGMAAVTWDGVPGGGDVTPDAGLNVDFTNGGMYHGISLGLAVDRAGAGQILKLMMHSPEGVSSAEIEFPVVANVSPDQTKYIPFSDFTGDADPTNITAFQLLVDETMPSLDARISGIGLTGANPVSFPIVPEPTGYVPILLGLAGISFLRRRR